jgi:CheY-like chemotaxis protein
MEEVKGKILVVEDDADEAALIRMILELERYEVILALNGKEGLQKIESTPPDLIILDVMMPELQESPGHRHMPVILLSSVAKRIRETKYPLDGVLRADAGEYFEKPVKPKELLETVARLLAS